MVLADSDGIDKANCSILASRPIYGRLYVLEYARMYKIEGLSTKARQFVFQNPDLQLVTDDGILIQIIDVDGWLHLMLDIGQYVSNPSTAIRKAAKLAAEWNKRLLDYQGAWTGGGDNELMERLLYRFEHGKSYKELAEMVNGKVEEHLREYLAYRAEINERYPEYKTEFDNDFYFYVFSTEFKNSCMGLNHARDLLRAIGLKDDEIRQELIDGLERIIAGKKPFPPGRPVSKVKMIYTLDNWREGKKHKAIQAAEQTARDEFITNKMNGRKQAEIRKIMQKMADAKRRIEVIGEKMIKAIEEAEV
jgi:hypothetical protein